MDERQKALREFVNKVHDLRAQSGHRKPLLTEHQFDAHITDRYFAEFAAPKPTYRGKGTIFRACLVVIVLAIIYSEFRQCIASLFMKNIQSCIYTGMSVWRMLTMPLLRWVPALTELYDESCLVANPLFQIHDLDCRPCEHVLNVVYRSELGVQKDVVGGGVPFVFKVEKRRAFS